MGRHQSRADAVAVASPQSCPRRDGDLTLGSAVEPVRAGWVVDGLFGRRAWTAQRQGKLNTGGAGVARACMDDDAHDMHLDRW